MPIILYISDITQSNWVWAHVLHSSATTTYVTDMLVVHRRVLYFKVDPGST